MATVTFFQPTDMSSLPGTGWYTYFHNTNYEFTMWHSDGDIHPVPDVILSGIGSFNNIIGRVTIAAITLLDVDTLDHDSVTNFMITDITVGSNNTIISALNSGSMAAIVAAVLVGNDTITGSAGVDNIQAWAGNDTVHGRSGADFVDGNLGHDKIFGEPGNDILGGSNGADLLVGGPGADDLHPYYLNAIGVSDYARDIIRYVSLSDSGTAAATRDEIFGFIKGTALSTDRIDLSPLDANPSLPGNQAFHFVSSFTAAKGEVHFVTSGNDTIVQVDGDNDTAVDMTILVHHVLGMHSFDLIL